MKVLLINPNLQLMKDIWLKPWIPVGILSLSAYLKKNGIETKILDLNYMDLDLEDTKQYDVIGISSVTLQYNSAIDTSKKIRAINNTSKIIFGGVHFLSYSEDDLDYCDACVLSEGEETLLKICQGAEYSSLDGIAFKTPNGSIVHKNKTQFIQNLDDIPFPDYEGIDLNRYGDCLIGTSNQTYLDAMCIQTARGCPYECVFCACPILWQRKVRFYSIDYTIDLLKHIVNTYGITRIRLMDETIGVNKIRVYELCDRLEQENLQLNLNCYFKAPEADLDIFKRLVSVGFTWVSFGVESGNQQILNNINKNLTLDSIRRAVDLAKQAGLYVEGLFMIGHIGETVDTLQDTYDFAKELKAHISVTHYATPFPGTKFYETCRQHGTLLNQDYAEYTSRKPLFIPEGLTKEILEEWYNKFMGVSMAW